MTNALSRSFFAQGKACELRRIELGSRERGKDTRDERLAKIRKIAFKRRRLRVEDRPTQSYL